MEENPGAVSDIVEQAAIKKAAAKQTAIKQAAINQETIRIIEILTAYHNINIQLSSLVPIFQKLMADVVALDKKLDRHSYTGIYLRRRIRFKDLAQTIMIIHNCVRQFVRSVTRANVDQISNLLKTDEEKHGLAVAILSEISNSSDPDFR